MIPGVRSVVSPRFVAPEQRMRWARFALILFSLSLQRALAMRLVLQRVKSASITVDSQVVSSIGRGVLALVGLHENDSAEDLKYCAKKLCASKLWDNENEKSWRKSVKQLDYEVLLVSQVRAPGVVCSVTLPGHTRARARAHTHTPSASLALAPWQEPSVRATLHTATLMSSCRAHSSLLASTHTTVRHAAVHAVRRCRKQEARAGLQALDEVRAGCPSL